MQQIRGNVFAETKEPGCNPGAVVTTEGIVFIDSPQQPSYALKLQEEMKQRGEFRYLINTEPHNDHVIGNYFFPVPVIAHQKTREVLFSSSMEAIMERVQTYDPDSLPLMEKYFLKKPSITFSENLTLHLGDHTFELIHMPGHTAGNIAVYIPEEKVVFTGDNIFHKVQTFLHQAYPEQWLESLKKIDALDVEVIIPGHGEICDKSYLKEQGAFLQEWVDAVKEAIHQGLSKEEALEKISFFDRYPIDVGHTEAKSREVQRMNVNRLYDMLNKK